VAVIVADTDVLIDFLGGHDPAAARVALELERGDLRTTAVTRFELLSGARSPKQRTNIVALLGAIGTLPLDAAAADRAAEVRRSLDEKGIGIGMGDSLIAGIVLVAGGVLLTRNRDHFKRVEGLHLGRLGSVAED
jgi:predicted nucleic acid-binding protein